MALPRTSQTGANEWADVETNDQYLYDKLFGNITNAEIAANAAIAYSKMAAIPTGSALIGNAGTPTVTALSGDVTVGATGVTAIGNLKVLTAMIAAANVTGPKLAADVVGAYRTVQEASAILKEDAAANTYWLGTDNSGAGGVGTTTIDVTGVTANTVPAAPIFYLDDADYAIAGLTTKLRIRAQVACNGTAPGTMTFTFGLYPITASGAADDITYTPGTVVAGSTAVATNPSANTINSAVGSDVNVPADGAYALCVVTNATTATNAAVGVHAQLQLRHV